MTPKKNVGQFRFLKRCLVQYIEITPSISRNLVLLQYIALDHIELQNMVLTQYIELQTTVFSVNIMNNRSPYQHNILHQQTVPRFSFQYIAPQTVSECDILNQQTVPRFSIQYIAPQTVSECDILNQQTVPRFSIQYIAPQTVSECDILNHAEQNGLLLISDRVE